MPKIHLVEGPVGAGKSTFSRDMVDRTGGVHIALDEWFVRLYSPDRPEVEVIPWYQERKARLIDLIWLHAQSLHAGGTTTILELGLVQRERREELYRKALTAGIELEVNVLDASRNARRQRVARRNLEKGPTYSMTVPPAIFEMASDMWESPNASEIAENNIKLISTES